MEVDVTASSAGSIHSALQAQGIELDSQCHSGFCGACRCKLKKGSVKYSMDPMAALQPGEVLTCCSTPVGKVTLLIN
tara:strand:+ start:662 stop:892 length:231 start_codon:yes stop_codon:yes gene_type:complete